MGNPEFAVPSLQTLTASNHEIAAVVTNPPKRMGRGKNERPSAVHQAAIDLNIPVMFADSLKSEILHNQLNQLTPDLFCVVAYRILPKELLQIPRIGAINLHGSLLPIYRGAAPIQRAIMNGDISTGLTTFFLNKKVDTGEILLQKSIQIKSKDTYGTLSETMSILGADLLLDTIDMLESGRVEPVQQDHTQTTSAPKIKSEEREINWSNTASEICNHIRGITPIPGAYTTYKNRRFKLFETDVVSSQSVSGVPGMITEVTKSTLIVNTGNGLLSILSLQREGKKRMLIKEFLIGSPFKAGDIFGAL